MVYTINVQAEINDFATNFITVNYYPVFKGMRLMALNVDQNYQWLTPPSDLQVAIDSHLSTVKADILTAINSGDWNGYFQFDANQTQIPYIYNDVTSTTIANINSALSGKASSSSVNRVTSTLSASLTTGTGATGTQIHATKDSTVRATCSVSTTATIGGASTSLVIAEICDTNSSTPGDWIEVARIENDQTITLAIALQSIQTTKGQINFDLPGGWYYKLRNSGTGTHTEAYVSGQKTIYG